MISINNSRGWRTRLIIQMNFCPALCQSHARNHCLPPKSTKRLNKLQVCAYIISAEKKVLIKRSGWLKQLTKSFDQAEWSFVASSTFLITVEIVIPFESNIFSPQSSIMGGENSVRKRSLTVFILSTRLILLFDKNFAMNFAIYFCKYHNLKALLQS